MAAYLGAVNNEKADRGFDATAEVLMTVYAREDAEKDL